VSPATSFGFGVDGPWRIQMRTEHTTNGRAVYRLTFSIPVNMDAVEETLLLAVLAIGCLYGESAIRLDAGYAIDKDKRVVVINAHTRIGCAVARVFVGFCMSEFGEGTFAVSWIAGSVSGTAGINEPLTEAAS